MKVIAQPGAVLGLDLGGTKLSGACFRKDGTIIAERESKLGKRSGRQVGQLIRSQALDLLEQAEAADYNVGAIGICVPGIFYETTGRVWAPNIMGWSNYPLLKELEQAFRSRKLPVVIGSDRTCYILGEASRGAARDCQNAVFLAVGTGIGAGIMVDGIILRGAHDAAGAVGWLTLNRPFCGAYARCGCFETHASGPAIARLAWQLARKTPGYRGPLNTGRIPSTEEVFACQANGDVIAKKVVEQAIQTWGMAVANLVSLLNPEKIIFGGGVFGPAGRFLKEIYAEGRKWGQPKSMRLVKLELSKLGGRAGLFGAGELAWRSVEKRSKKRKRLLS